MVGSYALLELLKQEGIRVRLVEVDLDRSFATTDEPVRA
jgi:hypothetical protein